MKFQRGPIFQQMQPDYDCSKQMKPSRWMDISAKTHKQKDSEWINRHNQQKTYINIWKQYPAKFP